MKCRIKKIKEGKKKRLIADIYFINHLELDICSNRWGYIDNAKVFDSVAEGRKIINKYKLKNVEVEKIK